MPLSPAGQQQQVSIITNYDNVALAAAPLSGLCAVLVADMHGGCSGVGITTTTAGRT
jgi:hypothetical protein